ncbi:IclR family transcriptional regulator C-terminal domain-containing protein [Streptomyces sp. NPDC087263]|uniref:IclR family transcriptional regulator domain-containing protein n=1 Tax=Streptomyces sp. NPDC087263 TaxID=3365773 RepID=UPI0037F64741
MNGERLPLHATAVGKVVPAYGHGPPATGVRHTPYTLTAPGPLRAQPARIRETGPAGAHEEYRLGELSLAAPVSHAGLTVAAVAAVTTGTAAPRDTARAVRDAAAEHSTRLRVRRRHCRHPREAACVGSAVLGTVDASVTGERGVSDGARVGVLRLPVKAPLLGRESAGSGFADGVGADEGLLLVGGAGVAGALDAGSGLVAGGGARGTVGETAGSGVARRTGSEMTAATAHDRPTPAAARSSLRRTAPRRIAS